MFFPLEVFAAVLIVSGLESNRETLLRCSVPIDAVLVVVVVKVVVVCMVGVLVAAAATEDDSSAVEPGASVVGGVAAGGITAVIGVVVSLTSLPSRAEYRSLQLPS